MSTSRHISQNVSSCFYFGYTTNRSSHRRSSVRKSVLRISQISQENISARVCFFNKVAVLRCFPVNSAKFFKNTFFTEHLRTTSSGLKKLKTQKYISTKNIFSLRFLSKKLILLYEFYQSTRAILRSPFPFFWNVPSFFVRFRLFLNQPHNLR